MSNDSGGGDPLMRAFFCLDLDEATRQDLDRWTKRLSRLPVRANWVPPANLHITLVFLGDIDDGLVPDLEGAARRALEAAGITAPLDVPLDRLGAFPHPGKPRVVWAGCTEEPDPIVRLARSLEQELEPLGFEPEDRPFTTHVTLGRVKERGRSRAVQELTSEIEGHEPFLTTAHIDRLTLMRSERTPQGPRYTPVLELPFEGEASG